MTGSTNGAKPKGRVSLARIARLIEDTQVEIEGVLFNVHHLDGAGWELVERCEVGDPTVRPSELYAEVRKVVPDAPAEAVARMILPELNAVLAIAAGTLKAVEDSAPKEEAPTTKKRAKAAPPSSA